MVLFVCVFISKPVHNTQIPIVTSEKNRKMVRKPNFPYLGLLTTEQV